MDFFAQGPGASASASSTAMPWCVLLVDDDPEVHDVTRLALRKFEFQQRGLELLSAFSARQAQDMFRARQDIALAVIDVVMETEHAGLELVRWLRDTEQCPLTRLVLRTGQAGLAPEEQVIRQFDIDAYKEKTELTTLKLRSLLYTSLRSYRTLCDKQAEHDALLALMQDLPVLRAAATHNEAEQLLRERLRAHFQFEQWPGPWTPPPGLPDGDSPGNAPFGNGGERPAMGARQRERLQAYLTAAAAAWPVATSHPTMPTR